MNPFKQDNDRNVARGLLNAKNPKDRFKGVVTWFTGHHDLRLLWIDFKRPVHRGALDYVLGTYEIKRCLEFLSRHRTPTNEPNLNNWGINIVQGMIMFPYAALTAVRLILGGIIGAPVGGIVCGLEAIATKCKRWVSGRRNAKQFQVEKQDDVPVAKAKEVIKLEKTEGHKVNFDALPKITKGLYWRITKTGTKADAKYKAVCTPIPKKPSEILIGTSKLIMSQSVFERAHHLTGSEALREVQKDLHNKKNTAKQKLARDGRNAICHSHRLTPKGELPNQHTYTYIP